MKAIDIIRKKRDGLELTKSEIDFLIDGYTNDLIPDYQMSALLMAIYFQKMSKIETVYLTQAIINSGERINLDQINGIKVDKHSTGGVGDKTTIALAPIIASLGAPLAKMSGRGLGHTGGTLDKLEAIPGLSTDLEKEDFIRNVNESKIAIAGQTGKITPADKNCMH
jgi:thymidine phosphorylase (EC 2.4.2.4)